jgi:hypothetical protein
MVDAGVAGARSQEWLETDGLGGFASGTVSGVRTRRYHGLLVAAASPPVGRRVLVSGLDAVVTTPGGTWWLSSQRYAPDVVGGVGLLAVGGRMITDWEPEKARAGFATERHPRTVIGTSGDGRVWLITVDGRNPALSLGMNFAELQALARRVGLVDALNLDGGGSTTMVVNGSVRNHPSDLTGPRRVSDAITVSVR